jgi:hypothetical protein
LALPGTSRVLPQISAVISINIQKETQYVPIVFFGNESNLWSWKNFYEAFFKIQFRCIKYAYVLVTYFCGVPVEYKLHCLVILGRKKCPSSKCCPDWLIRVREGLVL